MLSARANPTSVQARRAHAPRPSVALRGRVVAKALPRWPEVYQKLSGAGLETVSPEEASKRIASGEWVLLDVRLREQHDQGHPEGAVNVPLYESINFGGDVRRTLKALLYKSNGVNPVDLNPNFVEQLRAATAGKNIIAACEAGGSMRATQNFPEGKPSRSLQAAYVALTEGLAPKVAHLERGVFGWYQSSLPMVGDYKPDIGRTPMAAQEPQLKAIAQSTGYEMRPEDKPVEAPAKKNPLWPW